MYYAYHRRWNYERTKTIMDKKISELNNYSNVQNGDVLPILDVANAETKKISWTAVKSALQSALNFLTPTGNGSGLTGITAAQVGAPSGSGTSTGTNTGDETQSSILTKLGYTPESTSNKITTVTSASNDTQYPSGAAAWEAFAIKSAGCTDHPTFTDNGAGSVTIGNGKVSLYDNAMFEGVPREYSVAGITVTLTDNTVNYIVADYNAGSPILKVITDVSLITESNITPVYTIVRTGSDLHTLDWNEIGLGLANKLHQSIVKTTRYRRESGLAISATGTLNILLSSGRVWVGAHAVDVDAMNTSTGDTYTLYYHSSGNWTSLTGQTQFNNTQYDNGTNLATLTAGRYAVNWVYRGIESQKHLYITLGVGDYTLTQAQEAQPPTPPTVVSAHAVLVGKIIVQNGASSALSVQSAFDTTFVTSGVTNHGDLSGLQGGTTAEYYHLTSAQHTIATQQASGSQAGYLASADWTTFNGKQAALGYTPENVSNKSTSVSTDGSSDTKYPSVKAVKDYADGLVAGLLDYRGAFDASGNTFPSTGGSGSAGAILKGDMWIISVAGTLGGTAVQIGDSLIASIDTPGQTAGNWNVLNSNISYVPENVANKETSALDTSTTKYPCNNVVKTAVDLKAPLASPTFTGTVTLPETVLGEAGIKLDDTLSADEKWSGITIAGTLGATIVSGDLCYLNNDDGRWELADANLSDGYDKQLGICLAGGNDGSATTMLVFGKVRSAAFPAFTTGSPLYMSETAGDITHTQPTTADACIRLIGFALSADDMLFNPSNDYIIHT
jgi:hypothetical protein